LILGVLVFLYACDGEPRPHVKIKKISINNVGDFDYQHSLTFATVDTLQYEIKIITDPEDAEIYYTANSNFSKQRNEWILIDSNTSQIQTQVRFKHKSDSNTSQIQFYAEKQGFNKSDIKALDLAMAMIVSLTKSFYTPIRLIAWLTLNSIAKQAENYFIKYIASPEN
jgi:hypothetical protein